METPALPPNWRSARAADGKEYYFNELTGETSWTVPAAPAAEAAASVPAALVTELADGKDDEYDEPAPSASADPASKGPAPTPMVDDNLPPGRDEVPDLREGTPGMSLGDSLGPGGFKLMIVLGSSVVVMIESAILVDKIKRAENQPLFGSNISDADELHLEEACKSAGTVSELMIELLEAGLSATPTNTNYGVAVSSVSFFLCLFFMLAAKYRPATLTTFGVPLPRNLGVLSAHQLFYGFLLVWWGPGTGVLTFHGPYRTTGNPYFACWAALIASAMLCADAFTKMKVGLQTIKGASTSGSHLREMSGLFVASVTLFFASLDFADHSTGAYGISLGVISTAFSLATPYLIDTKKIGAPVKKVIAAVLFILWTAAAIVLTFDSPFTSTGNGYFACWLGLASAALFAYREFFEMQVQFIDGRFRSFSLRQEHLPPSLETQA